MAEAEAKLSQKLAQIIGNENYYYVAVKGSPFSMDCVAFGLTKEEVLALSKKFPNTGTDVVNGVVIKGTIFVLTFLKVFSRESLKDLKGKFDNFCFRITA